MDHKSKITLIVIAGFMSLFVACEPDDNGNGSGSNIISTDIIQNTTWESGKTYVISGSVSVEGAILTIQPGTTIKFEAGASLHIGYSSNATLIANGTADKPIVFTSNASNPTLGSWEGITFWEYSLNSSMQFCTIEYAGKSGEGAVNLEGCAITFSNNIVRFTKDYGLALSSEASFTEMNSNSFSDCGNHPLRLPCEYMHTIGTGNVFTCPENKGVNVYEGTAKGNVTWRKLDKPYFVEGDLNFEDGTLTIEPGAIFKFGAESDFHIGYNENSTLLANGTAANPIVFTSSATVPAAGAWNGITFWENSLNSSMKYCTIEYAGETGDGAVNLEGCAITFSNNTVRNAKDYGLKLSSESSFIEMNDNQFENCGNHPLRLSCEFIHTIGTGNVFNCPDGKGINVFGGSSTGNITWRKHDKPYYVDDDLNYDNGTLTIEPGAIFKFGANTGFHVGSNQNSTLIATGTPDNIIEFTTSASSPAAGAWEGIYLWDNNSSNTSFEYCRFSYAGEGSSSDRASIWATQTSFSVNNCEFVNSAGWGIFLDNATFSGSGNTFSNCALGNVGSN
ncbi:right-handed parallel beta-helix repeat-containing protein [Tenuifilum thalassicum]|uniref:Right handed beta helix domain-containing protein n=1 Tax=Tenuifilum thalassicum TaxID=2590900 RepID=A0A7D3XDP6_9BACT|nr:right-handed parallel beta-helix repeat-containing protein [Tenuifilum thalassicum]QKG79267.1 hypothetical protein FHG85_02970 [Tenuifilum thalassicum]